MKYFVPIIGLLFLPGISQAQKSNPFKSIGKNAKVQTLSNGKYVESFDDDVLQRVGSVVINRRTKKIVELLDADKISTESSDNSTASRWYSIDPLAEKFYSQSPYSFAGNNPIYYVDIAGAFQYPASKAKAYADKYPNLTQYLANNIQNDIRKSPIIQNAIVNNSYGGFTKSQLVNEAAAWGNKNSPVITFEEGLTGKTGSVGFTPDGKGFQVDAGYAKALDGILGDKNLSAKDRQAALLNFYETVLHETTHVGDLKDGFRDTDEAGRDAMNAVYHKESEMVQQEDGRSVPTLIEFPDFRSDPNDLSGGKGVIDRKTQNGQTEVLPTLPK
jgi:hypothetical protein